MNSKLLSILALILFASCSGQPMKMTECINLDITNSDHLVFSENLKAMGFDYAMEFKPAPPMKKKILNSIFYLDVNNIDIKKKLSFSLFRIRNKEKKDTYAIDILIPYLVEHYGNYEEINFNVSKISSSWNEGTLKAKVWELKDRRLYLLESFYDKSINKNLDLMYIETKE